MKSSESLSYYDVHSVITDRLLLYRRKDVKSNRYYARAIFPPASGYKVFSTKTEKLDEAIRMATNRYYELAGRASLNISTKTESLSTLMKEYLDYKDRLKARPDDYETKYRHIYLRFIRKYFGHDKVTDLHRITQDDLYGYWKWRTTYWSRRAQEPEMIKSRYGNNRPKFMNAHRMSGKTPSHTTLNIEVQLFRSFFKWAVGRGYLLAGNVPDVVNPVAKIDKVTSGLRGTFTLDDYKQLKRFIMNRASNPVNARGVAYDGLHYQFERMYCFFFTMSAFGLRPSEAKHLTFDMVQLYTDPRTGAQFSVIDLPARLAKQNPDGSRKGRRIFSFDNELAYKRIHQRWLGVMNQYYGHCDPKTTYIFAKWVKSDDRVMNEVVTEPARMDTAFRKVLQQAGLHRDEWGRPRSAYALRKFYNTQRIKHNVPLPALAINTGHDIQTLWKWYQHLETDDMRDYLVKRDPLASKAELVEVFDETYDQV